MSNDSISSRHGAAPDRGQGADQPSDRRTETRPERVPLQAEFKRPERVGSRRFDDLF